MGPGAAEKVPAEQVQAELKEAGYRLANAPGFLPEQFFLVFTRQEGAP
jgi:hypothetical protein